jgi:hypothetical protein
MDAPCSLRLRTRHSPEPPSSIDGRRFERATGWKREQDAAGGS